jgi:hypothetical protein
VGKSVDETGYLRQINNIAPRCDFAQGLAAGVLMASALAFESPL